MKILHTNIHFTRIPCLLSHSQVAPAAAATTQQGAEEEGILQAAVHGEGEGVADTTQVSGDSLVDVS